MRVLSGYRYGKTDHRTAGKVNAIPAGIIAKQVRGNCAPQLYNLFIFNYLRNGGNG